MSSASGHRNPSRSVSSSTVIADNAAGYHDLKIDGYLTIKGFPTGVPIKSSPFTVGGHRWRICFFPNGDRAITVGPFSLSPEASPFLFLDEVVARPRWWFSVPPSDLHRHLADLLQSEKGADVVFQVGRETFPAHRCMLAARSPVFSAEFFGAMKESRTAAEVVQVNDMEAPVFKALLCFLYTDSLPEMRKEDEDVMGQHLLVAADRYDMERLKLMCEGKLCEYIDVGTAATILTLAEQHCCHGLKKACFHFLSDPEKLRAVMTSDGFKHLSRSCPSIKNDLMTMLAP
ncbi:BTB/POZ and MATH domain-containing protein 2-like [Panicum virgatum]|uniref:BTB/POZ and MATH domain-containing protein 2-like n=1 Tax=Panicum virgatum TaxID=38727 RepID=UPI0019D6129C|nr:BTB/POZ and MATH domain-containing protein 2-like [Panicum virgatum]